MKAGGRGLEPLVVQAPATPSRMKPENAGGLVPPNQDKEVFNRIAPGAVPSRPAPAAPKLPEVIAAKTPTPMQSTGPGAGPTSAPAAATTPTTAAQPAVATTPAPTEAGPSIASLIENMSGPTGGWRVQIAAVKSEDVAKSTWARLQSAHGDVLANLRMQAVRVDLGDKGVWYRVQAGPLDEKQAQSVCGTLKGRRADCVTVPPAR